MKSRRRKASESPQTISPRNSEDKPDEFSSKIPTDLLIEIFSKLPLKTIVTCRCVSKRWASVLRLPDFTELFLTKSLARPQLLFALSKENKKGVLFFTTPQPQNLDEGPSRIAVSNHHVTFRFDRLYSISSSTISGFVLINDDQLLKRRKTREVASVICNPSTGQSFTLPKMKTKKRTWMKSYLGYDYWMRSFLGYDPVEKQHKVLAMTKQDDRVDEHRVLTLSGNGNMTWRMIKCDIPHYRPSLDSICINGVLYYTAEALDGGNMVVCFDVRSEKYSYVELGMDHATLLDYNGKLATVRSHPESYVVSETCESFEMWVLENLEKHEWSKRVFNLPPVWKDVAKREILHFVGVTAANEFVLYSYYPFHPFHVYYYNFDKETVTRVEIQGMGPLERHSRVVTFLNHVENVKLMEMF